jgi:hypothetical protein
MIYVALCIPASGPAGEMLIFQYEEPSLTGQQFTQPQSVSDVPIDARVAASSRTDIPDIDLSALEGALRAAFEARRDSFNATGVMR